MNFVRRMDLLGIRSYLIGAFDEKSYHWMQERDIPCVLVTTELPSTEFGWFKDHKAFKLRVCLPFKLRIVSAFKLKLLDKLHKYQYQCNG